MAGSSATVVLRVCAWCEAEFAREAWNDLGEPEITTWGICPACLDGQSRATADRPRSGGKQQPGKPS